MNVYSFIKYCTRFLLLYCFFYYGTVAITGLSVPAGYYSPVIEKYFNYPAALRKLLLELARIILQLSGHEAMVSDAYHVRITNGLGVKVVYSCLGTGLLSFWAAFILANQCAIWRKLVYATAGSLFIIFLNSTRLALLVISANNFTGSNRFIVAHHHLLFNTACYILIILMILVYDRIEKRTGSHNKA